jgi:hypothetical protein
MSTVNELTYELDPNPAATPTPLIALAVVAHIPQTIIEFQLIEARREIRRLESRSLKAETRADVAERAFEIAKRRIAGFERLTSDLATELDTLRNNIDAIMISVEPKSR